MWQSGKIIYGVAYCRIMASVRGRYRLAFFLLISAAKTLPLNVTCLLEQAVVLPTLDKLDMDLNSGLGGLRA
jgi:hypothetical protein